MVRAGGLDSRGRNKSRTVLILLFYKSRLRANRYVRGRGALYRPHIAESPGADKFRFAGEVLNSIRTAPVVLKSPEGTPVQRSMSSTCRPARIGRSPRKKIP